MKINEHLKCATKSLKIQFHTNHVLSGWDVLPLDVILSILLLYWWLYRMGSSLAQFNFVLNLWESKFFTWALCITCNEIKNWPRKSASWVPRLRLTDQPQFFQTQKRPVQRKAVRILTWVGVPHHRKRVNTLSFIWAFNWIFLESPCWTVATLVNIIFRSDMSYVWYRIY